MNHTLKFRTWDEIRKVMEPAEAHLVKVGDGRLWTLHPQIVLMQFTGRFDKNCKEICEGDLVREGVNKEIYEIKSQPSYFTAEGRGYRFPLHSLQYPLEIVGNVFESPELIPKV